MDKSWNIVFIAAIFEVFWVTGLKYAGDWLTWTGTIIAIIVSFYLLIRATKTLPVSTVYAVFAGLGATGTVFTEIIFFNEPLKWMKIFLILILIGGVIGLKAASKGKKGEAAP
ncbi:DMT family transporter [Metabacillus arenae]|uniref:Multidrug efflux SMR transporter n=1 Tax=Metabacillus arenae TaxID=2771434 RepID=A0A926NIR3_9BACI|nr:multidrug efflux SMR transporter [Metabacillus arenae]MBD1380753.1 multidrug efflux SMR transporter [Metabacillus arenae]